MFRKASALAILLVASVAFAPRPQAQSSDAAALAQRLMASSGLNVQLQKLAGQMEADIRQNAANLDAAVVASLADAANEAFRPDRMQSDVRARIAKKLTAGDMQAALRWLETDVGKRVTRAEEDSASLDAEGLRRHVEGLRARPLPAERQQLIADLVSATYGVRFAGQVAETMALGVALGMDSLQPSERRIGRDALLARIRQAMPPDQMQAMLSQQMPVLYSFTYRGLPDRDLAAYLTFLKSTAGKRYHNAVSGALLEGLEQASLRVGQIAGQRQNKRAL